jgi:hypothetical protein
VARIVETINKIIGGISSSITNPVPAMAANRAYISTNAGLHSTEFLVSMPVFSAAFLLL